MNNEEKILEILGQMQADLANVKADLAGVKDDLAGVKGDLAGVKDDLAGVKDDLAGVKDDLAGVKALAQGNRVLLERDVAHKLSLLAEGHGLLVERLDKLEPVKELAEETRAKVDVIYNVVCQHSVDLQRLKNASILPFPERKQG